MRVSRWAPVVMHSIPPGVYVRIPRVLGLMAEVLTDTGTMTHMRKPRWRRLAVRIGRPRILSVRSRIVLSILAVAALGLAASGVASYVVQRQGVLRAVDAQLLHMVPELKTIASGKTPTRWSSV